MRKASKHTPPYPLEFRAEAIRLVRTSRKPHSEIARDLGLTSETRTSGRRSRTGTSKEE